MQVVAAGEPVEYLGGGAGGGATMIFRVRIQYSGTSIFMLQNRPCKQINLLENGSLTLHIIIEASRGSSRC